MIEVTRLEPEELEETKNGQRLRKFIEVQSTQNFEIKSFNDAITEPDKHDSDEIADLFISVGSKDALEILDTYIAMLESNFFADYICNVEDQPKEIAKEIKKEALILLKKTKAKITDEWHIVLSRPDTYFSTIDKASNMLFSLGLESAILDKKKKLSKKDFFNQAFSEAGVTIETIPEGSPRFPKGSKIALKLENGKNQTLSQLDVLVYEAICTICENEQSYPFRATPNMIWKAINGNDTNVSVDNAIEITQSVRKLAFTKITLLLSPMEVKAYSNLKNFSTRESYLINASISEDSIATINGQMVSTIFTIFEKPIMYEYGKRKEHFVHIPFAQMQIEGRNRIDTITIQRWVIKRIAKCKRTTKMRKTILLDTMQSELLDLSMYASKKSKSNAKAKFNREVLKIMENLEKTGYIKSFETIYKGRKLDKISFKI